MSEIKFREYKLRPIDRKDLTWLKKLRNDESTWSQLGTFTIIYEKTQAEWFKNLKKREDAEYFVFCKGGKNLGIVRITNIDRVNRSMCVGGDLIPGERGKGLSKKMYSLIFKTGFDLMGMNRLWLLVLETNKIAMSAYKNLGFKIEGKQRKAIYRNGKFLDYIMMSKLASEYYKPT